MEAIEIKNTVGSTAATAILYINPINNDFVALFPLTLEREDYNRTEKINILSQKLNTNEAPSGFIPSAGDITSYEPWGNIALFYKNFVMQTD